MYRPIKTDSTFVHSAGKTFFKKKKQPIPVDLTKADWGAQVARACAATYMYPASGSSLSIRCIPLPCEARHQKMSC